MKRVNFSNYSGLIGILIIFSLSIALFSGAYSLISPTPNTPTATKGVLDLSSWDFHSKGLTNLNGQWEFYEGQLLEPADFLHGTREEAAYLKVPGSWLGKKADGGMTRKGFGTYRLKIRLQHEEQIYGLKLNNIRMSHRLYINGNRSGEGGHPAANEENHLPGNTPYNTFLHTDGSDVEIVIQVANYEFVTGGIVNSIQFGLANDINNLNGIQLGIDIAAILIMGMFGVYHLSFYFMRRREKSYLFSGLYLFTLMVVQLFLGEKVALRLIPEMSFYFAYKLLDFSMFLSPVMIILFFYSIDARLLSKSRMLIMISPLLFFMGSVVTLPYPVHSEMKPYFFLYLGMVILYLFGRMFYLYMKKERDSSNRNELVLFIGSIISLGLYLIYGILYSENAVQTALMGRIGVVGFISFLNILLAYRFTKAYQKTEILSQQLTITNELKDEFLANTSHELKTPLHGIMNITSHLLEDRERTLTTKQEQNLWLIKDISIKLSILIHDLIDVTRLKHGELLLYPSIVDLKMVAQMVLDVLQFELIGKDVQLVNGIESDVWVVADENRLRQILYNLVQNAIKHTEKGSVKISSFAGVDRIHVTVEDTGSGIAPDKHEKIFEYFEQARASASGWLYKYGCRIVY